MKIEKTMEKYLNEVSRNKYQIVDFHTAGYNFRDLKIAITSAIDSISDKKGLPPVNTDSIAKCIGQLSFKKS